MAPAAPFDLNAVALIDLLIVLLKKEDFTYVTIVYLQQSNHRITDACAGDHHTLNFACTVELHTWEKNNNIHIFSSSLLQAWKSATYTHRFTCTVELCR